MAKTEKVPFSPYKGLVIIEVPKEAYPPATLLVSMEQWRKTFDEKAKLIVNDKLKVAAVGEGVDFVKPGDMVNLTSHCRVQAIEAGTDTNPIIWWVVRESELLVKYN